MEVFMLGYMPEAEKITASAGWATRSLESASEFNEHVTKEQINDMIKYSKDMKLSSVLNFPQYLFGFKDVSRSFTHQWVRYRMAAHMQQSLRYVELKPNTGWFMVPPTILQKGTQSIVSYIQQQQKSAQEYQSLLEKGVPAEDARFVLPIGTKTHITTAMNAQELLHVFTQRCCKEAQWEIRTGAFALATACYILSPSIFGEFGAYCISEGKCRGKGKGACKPLNEKTIDSLKVIANQKKDEFLKLETGKDMIINLTDELGHRVEPQVKQEVEKGLGWKPDLDFEVKVRIRKV